MQSFFPGPRGSCSCCKKEVFVRLGSLTKPQSQKWEASPALLAELYAEAAGCVIVTGEKYIESYYVTRKKNQYHRAPVWRKASSRLWRCPYCFRKASTLLWVARDGGVGQLPEELWGPFCALCFYVPRRGLEDISGASDSSPVYYLPVSPKTVREIERALQDGWGAKPSRDLLSVHGTEGLF